MILYILIDEEYLNCMIDFCGVKCILVEAMEEKIEIRRRVLLILPVLFIIIFCVLNGLHCSNNANFFPMDGTYQNYNSWRRILVGEVPFRDFVSLYGLGQVYVGAFLTLILGGSYADSMVAADILSLLCTALLLYTIQFLVLRDHKQALYSTSILTGIIAAFPKSLLGKIPEAVGLMINIAVNNNNARMLRAAIVSIVPLAILGFIFLWLKYHQEETFSRKDLIFSRIFGTFAMSGVLWENCMGISIFISVSLMWFILVVSRYKRQIRRIVILFANYCFFGFISFAVLLILLTRSGFTRYVINTFFMGDTFYWYTNNGPKVVHISDFPFDIWVFVGLLFFVYLVSRMLKSKEYKNQICYMLSAAMFFSALFANYIYNYSSGGVRQDTLIPLIIGGICSLAICGAKRIYSRVKSGKEMGKTRIILYGVIVCFSILCCIRIVDKNRITVDSYAQRGEYFETLGGYIDKNPLSRWDAESRDVTIGIDTIKSDSLFSTYSTAVDVISNTFQPSGFDYMIYALGDQNQEMYVDSLKKADAMYVQTMNPEFNPWDVWDKGQNWRFWKYLYGSYYPYRRSSNSLYWRKDVKIRAFKPDVITTTERIDNHSILIKASSSIKSPFVAFVEVEYSCDNDSHLSSGLLRKIVEVRDISYLGIRENNEDYQFGWFMPQSGKRLVPITVYNGIGQIKLSAYNAEEVTINVSSVEYDNSYRTPYQFFFCDDYNENGYSHGVDYLNGRLVVANSLLNREILSEAKYLEDNINQRMEIKRIVEKDSRIIIEFASQTREVESEYPNMIKVITVDDE